MYCSRCGAWMSDDITACATCGAARSASPGLPVTAAPPAPGASHATAGAATFVYGGFWRRAAGLLVDELVLFFPGAILRVALGLDAVGGGSEWGDPTEAWAFAATIALAVVYHAVLASSAFEGTLGQRLLDLRVCDGDGRRLSFARALARSFAYWLSPLTCGFGWLIMLWTPRRQALHDLVCGTLVVRGAPPARHLAAADARLVEAR